MTNEIVPTEGLEAKKEYAILLSRSNLLPRQYQGNPANLLFALEYADAVGVSRIHALISIAVINGKPSPSSDLMATLVRRAGHKLRVTGDDKSATAQLIRSDDPDFVFEAVWDEAKARKAGLWGNRGPWTNYPAAMLRARAISEVVRMGAADCLAGAVYTPEEAASFTPRQEQPSAAEDLEELRRQLTGEDDAEPVEWSEDGQLPINADEVQ